MKIKLRFFWKLGSTGIWRAGLSLDDIGIFKKGMDEKKEDIYEAQILNK